MIKAMLLAPVILWLMLAITGGWLLTLHRRKQRLTAGTAPGMFPPESVIPIGGIYTGNKLGNTAAFATTVFFQAPTAGFYALGWAIHINTTDAAGSITATVTAPNNVAIPGVQAAPGTPSDGKGPLAPYYLATGAVVTMAVAVSGLTGTNFDAYVFAQRLF